MIVLHFTMTNERKCDHKKSNQFTREHRGPRTTTSSAGRLRVSPHRRIEHCAMCKIVICWINGASCIPVTFCNLWLIAFCVRRAAQPIPNAFNSNGINLSAVAVLDLSQFN